METVSYSTKLRDVYNDRWWSVDSEAFFAHHDKSKTPNKAGMQLYYQYGHRSDDFLVDNYGFCLDPGRNPFSSWKFRVVMGSQTPQTLSDITELIPTEAHRAIWSQINDKTELMAVQSDRISEPLFEYLRSVLQGRYKADGGADGKYLVISSPWVIKYEIFVVTMALQLLDTVSQAELFHRSSLEES